MFVLRIIEENRENENKPFEQVISNYEMGKAYSVIRKGVTKEFDAIMERYPELEKGEVSAILCTERKYEETNEFLIMHPTATRQYSYFVMTESGKTFEKL